MAIFIGIIFILIFSKLKNRSLYQLPIFSILSALVLFYIYKLDQSNDIGSSLIRNGTSGRNELWSKSLEIWLNHPILGVGGNNFLVEQPFIISTHPHNIIFKFLSEWGLGLLFFIFYVIILFILIFKNTKKINVFIFSGIIAIAFNSLLSGNMIYPVSQILNIWLIAYGLSFLSLNTIKIDSFSFKIKNYLWIFLIIVSITGLLSIHLSDIFCNQCISIDFEGAPGFWDYGRAIHLNHDESE